MKTFFLVAFIALSGWLFLERQRQQSEIADLKSTIGELQAKLAIPVAQAGASPGILQRRDLSRLLDPATPTGNAAPAAPPAASRNWIQEKIDKDRKTDSLDPHPDPHHPNKNPLNSKP